MYGVYDEIIKAAERALLTFNENSELLEYPEVQADKAYYLSILGKYNFQTALKNKLERLIKALDDKNSLKKMLSASISDEEKSLLLEELSITDSDIYMLAGGIAKSVGCPFAGGKALCRIKAQNVVCAKTATDLYGLIKNDISAHGGQIKALCETTNKNGGVQIDFTADGEDAYTRLYAVCGVHKVIDGMGGEIFIGVTPAPEQLLKLEDCDVKLDLFHSSGAGGQNINKVETAVRLTHIPTGTVVVCQDERSQLKNKKKAFAELEKRVLSQFEKQEKARTEEEFLRQQKDKSFRLVFDVISGTVSDKRLPSLKDIPLPMTLNTYSSLIDALISKGR